MDNIEDLYEIDLGHDHHARKFGWHPDRDLNPQFEGIPDVDFAGVAVAHPKIGHKGEWCVSAAHIKGAIEAVLGSNIPVWDLVSEDPLHVEPSLLCRTCGDHGWIRNGLWVPC